MIRVTQNYFDLVVHVRSETLKAIESGLDGRRLHRYEASAAALECLVDELEVAEYQSVDDQIIAANFARDRLEVIKCQMAEEVLFKLDGGAPDCSQLMKRLRAAIRLDLKDGHLLIYRVVLRWYDDSGKMLSGRCDFPSLGSLAEASRWEVIHDFNDIAVVKPIRK